MVYVIQVCWQLASEHDKDRNLSWSCSQALWHIPLLCAQWKTPDDGQRNCPKHVEFYYKNKFEKLVHLVGFIIRIYHDARSPERDCTAIFCDVTPWSPQNFTDVSKELMMAEVGSPKTSAHIYRTAWSPIPEDGNINLWAYINKWFPTTTGRHVFMLLMEQTTSRHLRIHLK